jgi:hypothetical protein
MDNINANLRLNVKHALKIATTALVLLLNLILLQFLANAILVVIQLQASQYVLQQEAMLKYLQVIQILSL